MTHRQSQRVSAAMYLVAGIAFLLTALLGDSGADSTFLVLAIVFVVLSLNAWRRSQSEA